jgi:hypothetical protein
VNLSNHSEFSNNQILSQKYLIFRRERAAAEWRLPGLRGGEVLWKAPYQHIYLSVPQEGKSRSRVAVARPQGRNSTVGSSISTHLSVCTSGEQEQEQSGDRQASGEEQYSGKLLIRVVVARPLGRNSTVGSSLSTHLSICTSGEQKQEQSGGSQTPEEEQYSGKLLIHTFIYLHFRRAKAGSEWW